ncbi:amphi-Trp domain-containing protein [Plantactinospora solaniradicis]|uniref:Amphi-Trp domain-containing protein n=1 Tax=Plantactinospora solaniradicis TaxID=1723736 RepID=A0ABW1KL30_9ACTN
MEIYEDARTVSRADLAAWLRQLASQLESGAQIFYGAAGTVTVADQVHCELEIEREDGEISVEIEFSWASPEAADSAATSGEQEASDRDEDASDRDEDASDRDEEVGEDTGKAVVADEVPEAPVEPDAPAATDGDAASGTEPTPAPTRT